MSEIFELSSFARAEARERHVVLPFQPAESATEVKKPVEPFGQRSSNGHSPAQPVQLIKKLCDALNSQQISYCHWKSNWKLNRWMTGDGDLDLLVARADKPRFISIISGLGFKQAEPTIDRQVPGILNFYGFDIDANKLVHLHVHYKLVIGNDLTKNYHLAAESLVLEDSDRQGLVPIPSRETELILFVLRMVLKYSVVESMLRKASTNVAQELEYLESAVDRARLANILPSLAPAIDHIFFDRCLESLRTPNTFYQRMQVRQELQKRLLASARRPRTSDALLKMHRRLVRTLRERLLGQKARKQFVDGGMLIAVVGGDGSGKTTALQGLNKWLGKRFETKRFHIGKPRRSPITLGLIVLLRGYRFLTHAPAHPARQAPRSAGSNFPGYLQILRWVSAGRDRRRLYIKARRFATNGGIALCDRYPVAQLQLMDGPNIARTILPEHRNRLVKLLMKLETNYYRQIMPPDLLIVLRVDPDVAVQRKTTEYEHHVRTRSSELWEQDWSGTNAYVLEAGQPAENVMAEAQSIIWSRL
jgi:thymidylate kinase